MPSKKLKFAVVCSSNMNRSMEAHRFMSKKNFDVQSFGTGNQVKLPGPAANKPNVYSFDWKYEDIYAELKRKDQALFHNEKNIPVNRGTRLFSAFSSINGLLRVDDQDFLNKLKRHPFCFLPLTKLLQLKRRFEPHSQKEVCYVNNGVLNMLDRNRRIKDRPERFQDCKDHFDVVIALEERVYDQIMEDFNTRESELFEPVHIINIDIPDNHEEATIGAFIVCELAKQLQDSNDLDNDIDELLQEFEDKAKRRIMHAVQFY